MLAMFSGRIPWTRSQRYAFSTSSIWAGNLYSGARRKFSTRARTPTAFAMCPIAFRSVCIEVTTEPPEWLCNRTRSGSLPCGIHLSVSDRLGLDGGQMQVLHDVPIRCQIQARLQHPFFDGRVELIHMLHLLACHNSSISCC